LGKVFSFARANKSNTTPEMAMSMEIIIISERNKSETVINFLTAVYDVPGLI